MFSTMILMAAVGAIGWSAWTIWSGYSAATGTPWERFFSAFRGWSTLLWSHVVMVGGAVVSLLMQVGDMAGMPSSKVIEAVVFGKCFCTIANICFSAANFCCTVIYRKSPVDRVVLAITFAFPNTEP